jgi:hypothetical protein
LSVTPGQSYAIQVGLGGIGGANPPQLGGCAYNVPVTGGSGQPGGATIFDDVLSAPGGLGGLGGSASGSNCPNGAFGQQGQVVN